MRLRHSHLHWCFFRDKSSTDSCCVALCYRLKHREWAWKSFLTLIHDLLNFISVPLWHSRKVMVFSRSLGNQWWEGLSLALLLVVFYFGSYLAKGYKEEKCNNECIVCEEIWLWYIKKNHLRNGHIVDLQSWQIYPLFFVWTYFWCREILPHLQSLKVMNRTRSCFYTLERMSFRNILILRSH